MKQTPVRFTPDQLRAIKEAPFSESDSKLATRIGVKTGALAYHRKKLRKAAGVTVTPSGDVVKKAKEPRAPKPILREPVSLETIQFEPEPEVQLPVSAEVSTLEPAGCATITLSVAHGTLDHWWQRLSIDQKCDIFASNLEYSLTSTVESAAPSEGGGR